MINKLEKIEKIVRKGYLSLSESLYQYWPLPEDDDKNEISESNINIHLAHSFLDLGYSVFAEHRLNDKEHYDLKVVSPNKEYDIIIECKRFLKTDSTGISTDIERMMCTEKGVRPVFGVVALLTQIKNIHDWWIDEERDKFPSTRHRSHEWENLYSLLKQNSIYCASVPLSYHSRDDFFHMGLYGIFKIQP